MLDMFHCAHITFYVLEYFFALQSDQIFAAFTKIIVHYLYSWQESCTP